jgi:hypothetical protein
MVSLVEVFNRKFKSNRQVCFLGMFTYLGISVPWLCALLWRIDV